MTLTSRFGVTFELWNVTIEEEDNIHNYMSFPSAPVLREDKKTCRHGADTHKNTCKWLFISTGGGFVEHRALTLLHKLIS